MAGESLEDVRDRVTAAIDVLPELNSGDALMPHMLWELRQLMNEIGADMLLPAEIMGILGIFIAAHTRILRLKGAIKLVRRSVPDALWKLGQLMDEVDAADLSASELVGLLTILAGAHSRILVLNRAVKRAKEPAPARPVLALVP